MKKQGTYNEHNEKWCGNCKVYHHKSLFGINRHSKDGIGFTCVKSRRVQPSTPEPPSFGAWKYKRPDAFEQYIASLPINHKSESDYQPKNNSL